MKKDSKIVFYDNSKLYELYDDSKQWLLDEGIDNPTDEQIWDSINSCDNDEWDYFTSNMKEVFKTSSFVARGTIQRWNGCFGASKVLYDYEDFIKFISGYDYVAIYEDSGKLLVDLMHHDGTHHFELRQPTSKGNDYIASNGYDCGFSDRLFNCNFYSKLPRLAHRLGIN